MRVIGVVGLAKKLTGLKPAEFIPQVFDRFVWVEMLIHSFPPLFLTIFEEAIKPFPLETICMNRRQGER